MDRCALFVDAGYVLSDGALAVHGTRNRDSVSWDYAGLLKLLGGLSRDRTGLPLLRCYWYDVAAADGSRAAEHDTLADIPGLKLRLSKARPSRKEGVEAEIRKDLSALARNRAVSDVVIVSAEEDLAPVIAEVQDLGIRTILLHIAVDGQWVASRTLRQECDDLMEVSPGHLRPYVDLIPGAEPHLAGTGYRELPAGPSAGVAAAAASGPHAAIEAPAPRLFTTQGYERPAQLVSASQAQPDLVSLEGQFAQQSPPAAAAYHQAASAVPEFAPYAQQPADENRAQLGGFAPADPGAAAGLSAASNGAPGIPVGGSPGLGQAASPQTQGMAQNGLGHNGVGGVPQNGVGPGGAGQNGVQPGGIAQNGAAQNGVLQNGILQNGVPQNGGPQNGVPQNGVPQPGTGPHGVLPSPSQGLLPAPQPPLPPGQAPGQQGMPRPSLPQRQLPAGNGVPYAQDSRTTYGGQLQPYAPPSGQGGYGTGPYGAQPLQPNPPQPQSPPSQPQPTALSVADAVQSAHSEGFGFGEAVARDAPALWLEAVLARKPRMPSDLEARLLQGSALPIDSLLHDEVRHALRRGFWDALERSRH